MLITQGGTMRPLTPDEEQVIAHGATEPPFRGNDALLTHLVHLCIALSSSER